MEDFLVGSFKGYRNEDGKKTFTFRVFTEREFRNKVESQPNYKLY